MNDSTLTIKEKSNYVSDVLQLRLLALSQKDFDTAL